MVDKPDPPIGEHGAERVLGRELEFPAVRAQEVDVGINRDRAVPDDDAVACRGRVGRDVIRDLG